MGQVLHWLDGIVSGDWYENIGVQGFELFKGCLGSAEFSDVFLFDVEVFADILNSHYFRVVDCDLFGSCEDEIFGDFDSKLNEVIFTPEMPWMKTLRAMSLPWA